MIDQSALCMPDVVKAMEESGEQEKGLFKPQSPPLKIECPSRLLESCSPAVSTFSGWRWPHVWGASES